MSIPVPNSAPPSCRGCAHVELIVVRFEGYAIPRDRCAHDVPMHPACAWHRTPEQIKAIVAQEQMTAQRIREPLGRRGL